MSTPTTPSAFMRFASAVADLGDPFYTEERQRDVWNEASAFGFQLLLWSGLALSALMLWFGGRDALPYAYGLLGITGLASALTIGYARRLGVDVATRPFRSRSRSRWLVLMAVLGLLVAGLLRSLALVDPESGERVLSGSTLAGFVTGATVALALVLLLARRARQRGLRERLDDTPDGDQG